MSGRGGVSVGELPHALEQREQLVRRLGGREPALFLDYDGTLTPIVDRPQDALISGSMRATVQEVARRISVCVVSERDRAVLQSLMGVDDLVVAGSHGFDIWSPSGGAVEHQAGAGHEALLGAVAERLQTELDGLPGLIVEPKLISVAVHYRLVPEARRAEVARAVEAVLADHPDELKLTPGKLVYEIQPKLDWDKGQAVLHLPEALELDRDDVVPVYVGDDITDEDAFEALAGRGVNIFVGTPDDPELAGRKTAADFVLHSPDEVERLLRELASRTAGSPA